jgi:hypothetical protein
MVAPGVFKHQETELERETRAYDEKEATVNAEVFAALVAHQAAERVRLARLRGEVAGTSKARGNAAGPGDKTAEPSEAAGDIAGPSAMGDNSAGVVDPSPADFLKAWKKIGSAKENKEWNGMEREVRNDISHSIHPL